MVSGAVLARIVSVRSTFRLITTVHNEWHWSAILMSVGDLVIAVSTSVAKKMQRRGIPAHKLRVVRNGPLGSPRRPPLEASGHAIHVRRPAIVTVGGLYQRKGIAELIAAFGLISTSFPHAYLYVIGDGDDANEFKTQAASMPAGFTDQVQHLRFSRKASAGVLKPRDFLGVELMAQVRSSMSRAV